MMKNKGKGKGKGKNLLEQYGDDVKNYIDMMMEEKKKIDYLLSKGYTREDFIMLTDEECQELYINEKKKDEEN